MFVLIPIAVIVVVLSVANRGDVAFSLDPIDGASSGWALHMPLFALIFASVIAGIVIGGVATWIGQGRWRHAARVERAKADRLKADVEQFRAQMAAITSTAISTPRSSRDAA